MNAVPMMERHNERKNKNYSNKDIDLSRSHLNYHLKQIQSETYQREFERIRTRQELKGNLRLHGEKQSTVMCEFLITSDSEFFAKLGAEKTKHFFKDAYDFVTAKVGGEQYVVSAVVHMDEKTPHMHVAFIPVVKGKDRKKQSCKRINCSEFWKGRDSYARLQDEYFDFISYRSYDLERGQKGSTSEHLSVQDFKLKKTTEQILELTFQIADINAIENVEVKPTLLGNKVTLSSADFENLSSAAKKYATVKKSENELLELKEKCSSLENQNHVLKKDNDILSGNLQQIEHNYGEFYASVEDEVVLKNENDKLKVLNARISNQVHNLSVEVASLKNGVREKDVELATVKDDLVKSQSLLKSLQGRFDRVMRFIENLNLKQKLYEFLKSPSKNRGR